MQNSRSFKGQRYGRNVFICYMWGLLHIRLLLYRVRRMLKSRSMYPDVHLVIQLQSLDQKITALEKEVAALPKHIAVIEKALESHLRKLEADKAALSANQKDRKRLEGDIQVHQQKISKLRDQMLQAKTNEQYKAFQHEIEFIEKEIRQAEDRILELMTESEPLDQNVKRAEKALAEEKKSVDAEKAQARERTAADQKELDVLRQQRGESVAKLPKPSLAAYEKIRKRFSNSTVVAEAVNGRCSGCQINLRPQFLQDLRKGDQLMFCESCGRFLYYNPPVSFEDAATVR
jgi:predicted  nucleic acid-binding Zn-ribbon protein